MNAAVSAMPRWRKVAVVAALLLATAAIVTQVTWEPETASGADDGDSATFEKVGDGSLPTTRPPLGEIREPLSAEETGYAIHVAVTDASVPADATDVNGEDGPEILYADLPESLDGTFRAAVVMLYDYTGDQAYQQLVDLEEGAVVTSTSTPNLQPPPSSDEADTAMNLAIGSQTKLAFLDEFEAAQGVPLISTEQVSYVAGSFIYDKTTKTGKECGAQRCAQLMVQTASGGYLSTWDFVVNLSTQSIVEIK